MNFNFAINPFKNLVQNPLSFTINQTPSKISSMIINHRGKVVTGKMSSSKKTRL